MKKTLTKLGTTILPLAAIPLTATYAQQTHNEKQPNVIYIMADDLGIGDLGCYGQKQIKTPAIDQLAANGIRFAQHYSGSTVSAPSRCSLMTGKHTGNAYIRGNKGVTINNETYDYPLKGDEVTVAEIFKKHNYATACIGKWGLGGPQSEGHPNDKGFDYFFGYLGQLNAHSYYPAFLWENDKKVKLNKKVYTPYPLLDKTLEFIEKNKDKPFFLYLSPTIPHADLLVPEQEMEPQRGKYFETPFTHNHYANQPEPRAAFAAMVTQLDKDVAKIVETLEKNGLLDNTIIVFTSDNGTHAEGGHDPEYFDSNGPFRGMKRDLYEGGIRTPFIVQWPGKIKPETVSYHVSAFWDFLPTVCDLLGESRPTFTDGISYLPQLTGTGEQYEHNYLYWEFHEMGGKQAILKDGWKLIRLFVNQPDKTQFELYNLSADPGELMDVAKQYPGVVAQLQKLMDEAHRPSELFRFKGEN
ncbi:arylsulfatase [Bacteroides sp. 519]|uniref:arylsulfatase n=1 Tax=Bacteroides sp. 519 TaxID=2302937 RepID=UPI0013CFA7DB|nr:arylsulfatase [Bacteroides sp. 519]NDV58637.1 DUF229 domain-containing protein [Bacteroides sp. 519]